MFEIAHIARGIYNWPDLNLRGHNFYIIYAFSVFGFQFCNMLHVAQR